MPLHLKLEGPLEESEIEKPSNELPTPPKPTFLASLWDKFKGTKKSKRPDTYARTTSYSDDKFFLILNDFLQPETTKSLNETVQSLLALLPENAPGSGEIYSAGEIIIEIAEQIPYSHPSQWKLIALVEQLSTKDKFLSKWPDEMGTRHRCSMLCDSLRDSLTGPNDEIPNEWPNLSAFYARIDACHLFSNHPTFAIWTMREAFEERPEDDQQYFAGMKDQCVIAAAQHILWDGQELFKKITFMSDVDEDDLRSWKPGRLYDGDSRYTLQRWQFWKAGFHAAAGDAELGDEARDVARRAATLMDAFESTMAF
ncbi:DUF3632 domain-containing protein [Aspergillus puulaauensis]|uniref:Uncharacterized protein n=1 Tax=Aspergillus puulaauensis TaxID=1220207 RepID=A0A7R7XDT6_9EURO|nr:uncharacterized protein APUU_11682S [Aspergillus puulaauensis]BCS18854.1 hypothetical protein APUU_11682S [Aspergillus puulaauensis]